MVVHKPATGLPILIPFLVLVVATLCLRATALDVQLSGLFYGGNGEWPMVNAQPFRAIYDYGTYPACVITILSGVGWIAGLAFHRGLARRTFFCLMVVLIGPGLMINGILKPVIARPRPCQIVDFGGTESFRPILSLGAPNTTSRCMSFPSGHASMGFALIAPALLLRRHRKWYVASMGLAIGIGVIIGVTRIVQGRHYVSDILWSGAIVYLSAALLYEALGLQRDALRQVSVPRIDREGRLVSVPWQRLSTAAPPPVARNRRAA